jgi:hypothetical protein
MVFVKELAPPQSPDPPLFPDGDHEMTDDRRFSGNI